MKTILVLSGAGLSVGSGIPTRMKFLKDFLMAKPHAGHHALADLEDRYNVVHWTQNLDSLLEQAGCSNVTHLHGTLDNVMKFGDIYVAPEEIHPDIIIIVGTSLTVSPANFIADQYKHLKVKYYVDRRNKEVFDYENVVGNAEDTLPKLLEDW